MEQDREPLADPRPGVLTGYEELVASYVAVVFHAPAETFALGSPTRMHKDVGQR
jgi:hypothetical protein